MKRRGVWRLIAAILCGAACATSTSSRMSPDGAVDSGRAYLYGRFFMNALPDEHSLGGKQSVGLVIERQDRKTYTFGSLDKRDVQVMEVRPGRYWLMKAIFADQYGMPQKTVLVDPKDQRPLDFAAGHAYYVGDFFAKGDFWIRNSESIWRGPIEHLEWAVSPGVGNHYVDTTAEMKRAFPNLAALPTVDLPLFLRREHKRDNGIGPSPDEPPMSPQRVAMVAPFIKQTFTSPSQCESACPAGQCLPYRGESGAAIICVIRCNRDADCPQPLACNCPNSEKPAGPACTPIASTPNDPLARICLPAPPAATPPVESALGD